MPERSFFLRICRITLWLLYLLILAGAVVRATGSGMGCPDWPKCFGKFVPPTSEKELPENYKELYKKGDRQVADFNVTHTWVEYINRLLGVLVGFFILVIFIISIIKFRHKKSIILWSFLLFMLVSIQGILGKHVVDTHLEPGIITLHMVLALIILAMLLYIIEKADDTLSSSLIKVDRLIFIVLIIAISASLIQVAAGTQVRELIDSASSLTPSIKRDKWLDQERPSFHFHRIFAVIVLLINIYLAFLIYRVKPLFTLTKKYLGVIIALIIAEFFAGFILSNFGLPAFVQPFHLVIATLIFGAQFSLLLKMSYKK